MSFYQYRATPTNLMAFPRIPRTKTSQLGIRAWNGMTAGFWSGQLQLQRIQTMKWTYIIRLRFVFVSAHRSSKEEPSSSSAGHSTTHLHGRAFRREVRCSCLAVGMEHPAIS